MKNITHYLKEIMDSLNEDGASNYMQTGITSLDSLIGGFSRSELVTIGGRTKMGKSHFVTSILSHLLINEERNILFYSLEKTGTLLTCHFLSHLTGLEVKDIQMNNLSYKETFKMLEAVKLMSTIKLDIDDTPSVIPRLIEESLEKLQHTGLDIVVIDYIQLMTVESGDEFTRATQLSEITRSLKRIARINNVCIIIVSQLNRDCDYRTNKRPLLIDLLDSGSIENDSDLVLLLYREEVYWKETPSKGYVEIEVAKNRNGYTGRVNVRYPF